MTELEERIVAFTAAERGMNASGVGLSSNLLDDLGIDGDEATKFFEKFGKEFHVDLSPLKEHWSEHFGGEIDLPLGCIAVIGAAIVLGDLLHRAFPLIPGWAGAIVLMIGLGWAYHRIFAKERLPLTVGDLAEAARNGKWVKQYGEHVPNA